jgi:hypothetical protein
MVKKRSLKKEIYEQAEIDSPSKSSKSDINSMANIVDREIMK